MWGELLKLICDKAQGRELFLLEADGELNWYGAPLSQVCSELPQDGKVSELVKAVRSKFSPVKGEGWVAYVDPYNCFADIYPADRPRYRNRWNPERPYDVNEHAYRIGFFGSKEEAYDLFYEIAKLLKKEKDLKFDVIYT
ncbi:MAG: hypothetical protein GXO03_03410 [Aquificae bacterium]|nr:hypothetical protein [Aquificota bacterium]